MNAPPEPRDTRDPRKTFSAIKPAKRLSGTTSRRPHAADRPERLEHPHVARTAPPDLVIDTVERRWEVIARDGDWAPLYEHIDAIRGLGEARS